MSRNFWEETIKFQILKLNVNNKLLRENISCVIKHKNILFELTRNLIKVCSLSRQQYYKEFWNGSKKFVLIMLHITFILKWQIFVEILVEDDNFIIYIFLWSNSCIFLIITFVFYFAYHVRWINQKKWNGYKCVKKIKSTSEEPNTKWNSFKSQNLYHKLGETKNTEPTQKEWGHYDIGRISYERNTEINLDLIFAGCWDLLGLCEKIE